MSKMNNAHLSLTADRVIGAIDPAIYGGFVEHLGRNIYGGIYQPGHPLADQSGFRVDVLAAVRELGMPVTRYPGGCFTDLWDWRDGIGPRENRPTRLDYAWKQLETNEFGLHEFINWARLAETEPMLTLNLGTGGVREALALVEYCDFPGGTAWSDRRRVNGSEAPFGIRRWCLGNEIYNDYTIGQREPELYGAEVRECAKAIKRLPFDSELILCGSMFDMEWNRRVLEMAWEYVDVLSVHGGFCPKERKLAYLAQADDFGDTLDTAAKICDTVPANHGSRHRINLSVDEWIIWDGSWHSTPDEDWIAAPSRLEQDFTIADALLAGELLCTFHNRADRVKIACIAQSVNVLAPIRTDRATGKLWKQSLFYPFALTSRFGRGNALEFCAESPTFTEENHEYPLLYGSAVMSDAGELAVFAINRSPDTPLRLEFEFSGFGATNGIEHLALFCDDPEAVNLIDAEPIKPVSCDTPGRLVELAPASWNILRFNTKGNF